MMTVHNVIKKIKETCSGEWQWKKGNEYEEHICSQKNQPGTYYLVLLIAQQISISKSAVQRLV